MRKDFNFKKSLSRWVVEFAFLVWTRMLFKLFLKNALSERWYYLILIRFSFLMSDSLFCLNGPVVCKWSIQQYCYRQWSKMCLVFFGASRNSFYKIRSNRNGAMAHLGDKTVRFIIRESFLFIYKHRLPIARLCIPPVFQKNRVIIFKVLCCNSSSM